MTQEKLITNMDIPDWVHYLAQDADGTWWGYEIEPHQYHNGWYENELGRRHRIRKDSANTDWHSSLIKL
jgi:hypothetical protein